MSLYLTVFDADTEIGGWVAGHYSDFGYFLACIRDRIPGAVERYPVLMKRSDGGDEWGVAQLPALIRELDEIALTFRLHKPEEPVNAFEHTREFRANAHNLYECFHNVDGENLFDALQNLAQLALSKGLPILFQ